MSTKVLRNVMSVFVLCSLVMCVSGCTTPIHVPLSEDHIPLGVQELVKQCADPDVFKINKLEYYVFEPEDDGYFVIAHAEADLVHNDTEYCDEFLVFGLVKKSVDAEGNEVWTGDLCAGGIYVQEAVTPADVKKEHCALCFQRMSSASKPGVNTALAG